MKIITTALTAAIALSFGAAAVAQTTSTTKVDTSMKGGDTTRTVTHVTKHKTRHVRRILGVKVGHKTRVHKVVQKTKTDAMGDKTTTVKSTHN